MPIEEILTTKKHLRDMTINDLLTEYKAIGEKIQSLVGIWLGIPEESSKKKEYYELIEQWTKQLHFFAKEIADKMTE